MELDIKSVRAGQFFTPWPVAEMMALVSLDKDDFKNTVSKKGSISIQDPAVGSGVMLLAYAKVVNDSFGRWGLHKLRLYGQDIDERCVLMCKIQLRMNGLDSFGRMAALMAGVDCSIPQKDNPGKRPISTQAVIQPAVQTNIENALGQLELF